MPKKKGNAVAILHIIIDILSNLKSKGAKFPDRCFRGIRHQDYCKRGKVWGPVFYPNNSPQFIRPDGACETSVNWDDDEYALSFTMGRLEQSKYGVAALPLITLQEENIKEPINHKLSWDHKRDPNDCKNKYHGNIIFSNTMDKALQRISAGILAEKSKYIPRLE